jgi:hypothetical protein
MLTPCALSEPAIRTATRVLASDRKLLRSVEMPLRCAGGSKRTHHFVRHRGGVKKNAKLVSGIVLARENTEL